MKISKQSRYVLALSLTFLGLSLAGHAHAAQPTAGIFDTNGKLVRSLKNIPAGSSVAVADLGTDGISEIIVGSPVGVQPWIRVLRLDGSKIRQFALHSVKGNPGVNVSIGDVYADGTPNIIASFGKGTTPEVRVYSVAGKRLKSFLAFGKGFRGGVNLTTGDTNNDGVDEIITGAGSGGGPYVVGFTGQGKKVLQFLAYSTNMHSGVEVFASDVTSDGNLDIFTATKAKNVPVQRFSTNGVVLSSFTVGKVQPASVHVTAQAEGIILLGSSASLNGKVQSYAVDGSSGEISFFPFGAKYSGGVTAVSVNADADAASEVLVVPSEPGVVAGQKRIVVDISDQRMYRYVGAMLVATHKVSTGKWSMPTPLGSHQIYNKLGTAYSRKYALYMDNWMAITADGAYGIHSLPYWRLKNGGIYYEGVAHLGHRVSHGCIRLSPAEAKQVFAWTAVGTSVQVVN